MSCNWSKIKSDWRDKGQVSLASVCVYVPRQAVCRRPLLLTFDSRFCREHRREKLGMWTRRHVEINKRSSCHVIKARPYLRSHGGIILTEITTGLIVKQRCFACVRSQKLCTSLPCSVRAHAHANISHPSIPVWPPRLKFINKASKLADTAITPSKINSRARGKREPLCARVYVCACLRACTRAQNYSSAVSSAEESVWTTAECFGSPTAPQKATQPLYLLQISLPRLPCTFPRP